MNTGLREIKVQIMLKTKPKNKRKTKILQLNPELGKKTEHRNTHAISLGHYSILYKIFDSKIIIIGFWDNRQQPKKLLLYLKSNQ